MRPLTMPPAISLHAKPQGRHPAPRPPSFLTPPPLRREEGGEGQADKPGHEVQDPGQEVQKKAPPVSSHNRGSLMDFLLWS